MKTHSLERCIVCFLLLLLMAWRVSAGCNPIIISGIHHDKPWNQEWGSIATSIMDANCLYMEVMYPGGCGKDVFNLYWDGNLFWDGQLTVYRVPTVNLRLLNEGDIACNNTIFTNLVFDIAPIIAASKGADSIIFNIAGYATPVKYIKPRPNLQARVTHTVTFTSSHHAVLVKEMITTIDGQRVSYWDGVYQEYDRNKKLLVSGSYVKNRKNGTWKYNYPNGILCLREYKDDHLISEKFLDNNEALYSGKVIEYFPGSNKVRAEYNVRNGIRHGMYKEFDINGKVINEIEYREGASRDPCKSVNCYLAGKNIVKEATILQLHDQGNDPYWILDRIRITDEYTLVYLQYQNQFDKEPTHGIRITSPNSKSPTLKIIDNDTKQEYRLINVLNVSTKDNLYTPVKIGEMITVILVFEKLPPTVNNIDITGRQQVVNNNENTISLDAFSFTNVIIK